MSSRAQRRRAARDTATCAVALVLTMLGAACGLFAQLSHNTGAAMGYALLAGLAFVAALLADGDFPSLPYFDPDGLDLNF